MFRTLRNIDADERRVVVAGFLTLLAVMTGHLLMETARDAVFLANIPATQLPVLYIVIAALALAVTRLQAWSGGSWTEPSSLIGWLLTSAAMAAILWGTIDLIGDAGIYLLYVLPGVISTVTLLQFWGLMGNAITVDDAKRIYVFLGAGGGVGAIIGSALATLLSWTLPDVHLILGAGVVWALTPLAVMRLSRALPDSLDKEDFEDTPSGFGWKEIKNVARQPYTRGLALLSLLIPMAATIGDYLFKSLAAEHVEAASLGIFFGSVYLGLNVLSLVIQLFAVRKTVRRLSIAGAVAILPSLLALGGIGVAAGLAFASAIGLKFVDGSLRHSLHSTSKELLFVPLSEGLRNQMKAVGSTLGKRGGQALGSVGLLGLIAVGADPRILGLVLTVIAAAATASALALRTPYLELFRSRLRDERLDHLFDYPELDADSLEDLVSRLSSGDDSEVIAALDLLESEGRARAIPTLILYHPSDRVVLRALSIFVNAVVDDALPVIERLEEASSPALHAALLSARAAIAPDRCALVEHLDHTSDMVRSTAAFHLVARGWRRRDEIDIDLQCIVRSGSPAKKRALAFAIGAARSLDFVPELVELLDDERLDVRRQAVDALTRMNHTKCQRVLIDKLPDRKLRPAVLEALGEGGEATLDSLGQWLDDSSLPRRVRWQLPRAIGSFDAQRVGSILADRLPREKDGVVRVRIVAQLEELRMIRENAEIPDPPLVRALESTIDRAFRQVRFRQVLVDTSTPEECACTSFRYLQKLIDDKESNAIDLVIRIAGLLYAEDDARRFRRGLESDDPVTRASGKELLEARLPPRFRASVLALVSDERDAARLQDAPEPILPDLDEREEVIERLLQTRSDGLALMVAKFAERFRLAEASEALVNARRWATGEIAEQIDRTLDVLEKSHA